MKPYANSSERQWDVEFPVCKGQRFNFEWGGVGKKTTGIAEATEDFQKVVLAEHEALAIDTHAGVHYCGKAIAYYN